MVNIFGLLTNHKLLKLYKMKTLFRFITFVLFVLLFTSCVNDRATNEERFNNLTDPVVVLALSPSENYTNKDGKIIGYSKGSVILVDAEGKTLDKIAPHILFYNLPSFRICEDFFHSGLEGFDERLGDPRTNVGIIRHGAQVFFKCLRVEKILHLLMVNPQFYLI